jgi:hypothetical protein
MPGNHVVGSGNMLFTSKVFKVQNFRLRPFETTPTFLSTTMATDILVSDRIKKNSATQSPISQKHIIVEEAKSPVVVQSISNEEMDSFRLQAYNPEETVDPKKILPFGPPTLYQYLCNKNRDKENRDEDDTSSDNESTSAFSSDSYPFNSSLPPIVRLRPEDEVALFADVYRTLDDGFRVWAEGISEDVGLLSWKQRLLTVPRFDEKNIIFGRCPGNSGFWTGNLSFGGPSGIVIRLNTGKGIVPAMIIGYIKDFGCENGALLFFAQDRACYHMDMEGDCAEDRHGEFYWGHGPYDLRLFGSMRVITP